jgi:hypothetical protein
MTLEISEPPQADRVDSRRGHLARPRIVFVGTLVWAVLAVLPAASAAAPFSIEYSAGLFGVVDQDKLSACKNSNGESFACGPAATVNGLVFLENRFAHYRGKLVPDVDKNGQIDEREQIILGDLLGTSDYMGCGCTPPKEGTSVDDLLKGKKKWIEDHVPNMTSYELDGTPTADLLYRRLKRGAAIELLVTLYDSKLSEITSHYVTLTGISFDDVNDDRTLSDGESGRIKFIDPDTGSMVATDMRLGLSKFLPLGSLFTDYKLGDTVKQRQVTLSTVRAAVIAVPAAPPTALLSLGIAAFAMRRRVSHLSWRNHRMSSIRAAASCSPKSMRCRT